MIWKPPALYNVDFFKAVDLKEPKERLKSLMGNCLGGCSACKKYK